MIKLSLGSLVLILVTSLPSIAQEEFGQALPNLLRGNEQFGRKLLLLATGTPPERNVVISPLSLTLIFAALQTNSADGPMRTEIGNALGWGEYPDLSVPARMLLVALEKPKRVPPPSKSKTLTGLLSRRPLEGAWITNTVLYRGTDTLSAGFVGNARVYYGVNFKSTGEAHPSAADLKTAGHFGTGLPVISAQDDVLISSGAHLQTAWSGNTFSMSLPRKAGFRIGKADAG